MPTITTTIDIKAARDDVWAVLSDMPATRHWLPGVLAARMDGDVRVCQMADGQQVHEKISDNSAEQRSFRFEHFRVPLPVRRSGGTFTVTAGPEPDTATVTLRWTFEPLNSTGARRTHQHDPGRVPAFARIVAPLRREQAPLGCPLSISDMPGWSHTVRFSGRTPMARRQAQADLPWSTHTYNSLTRRSLTTGAAGQGQWTRCSLP